MSPAWCGSRLDVLALIRPRVSRSVLPASTSQPPLLGLSLLSLLASSRIADFHTVLETLDEQMMNDVYVRWPIDL